MVHPSELLRTNSNEGREFAAPRSAVDKNQLDCGLTNFPFLNRCCNLEKFADPKVFLIFLSLVGFLQGVTLTYFRNTSKVWGQHYNISQDNIDWLIYTNEFLVGVIALAVAYWGNRIHRISWIGGLTMFHAIACTILIIPEAYRQNPRNETDMTDLNLCKTRPSPPPPEIEINYIALVVLIIYQIFYAMVSISFISHGITYIDDNTSSSRSPGYIGIALACGELGKQAGLYFSWIPSIFNTDNIFISPVWLSIAALVFISGILISMFPRSMPSALMHSMAASILDLASGFETPRRVEKVDGFFKTLFRLLRNRILMVNIFCVVFLQSGLINFDIFEKFFNQSRFQVAYETDTSYTQLTTNILKQPLVAISVIAAGMVIAKTKAHLRSLVKWNIAALILVIIFFGSTAFLRCEPKTKYGHLLDQRFCSAEAKCNCSFDEFQPICVNSITYYSPCLAGCTSVEEVNSKKVYKCECGSQVTEGPCEAQRCDLFYALSQVNRVITTALLASTLVTNLIINMRCILVKDKAVALALETTFVSLISFLPVKAIYGAVAEHFCIHRKDGVCRLFSENFGTFLSISTMGFMIASLILAIVVLLLLKYFPIIQEKDDYEDNDDHSVELNEVNSRPIEENRLMGNEGEEELDLTVQTGEKKSKNSNETLSGSLLELENVGDDHDSIDSSSHLDEVPDRSNRNRIIESDL